MKKPKKKEIVEDLSEIGPYDLDGKTPDEVIKYFEDLKKEYGPDCYIDWDPWFSYPYESERSPRYFLRRRRLETDAEFNKRVEAEAAMVAAQEERERAELARLQAKFGKVK